MDPLTIALLASGAGGLISGIVGGGETPQDEAIKMAMEKVRKYLPYLQRTAYSKSEIGSAVAGMNRTSRGAADVAAGKIGANLAESLPASGTPSGQPSGSIYTSEMAPVIASGEQQVVGNEQFGLNLFSGLDNAAKNRLINALGLLTGTAASQPEMTGLQRGVASFLQGSNLIATGYGNLMKGFKDSNYKPITVQ